MTPLTAATPCLETEESTEPPPSTRSLASQSHQLCRRPQLARHSSQVCTHTPAVHCTAWMSRSAQASSACQGGRRGVAEVRMEATGARRVRERSRVIASRRMRMDATATSGYSMTSVSRMLLRRDMERCSAGIIKDTDDVTHFAALLRASMSSRRVCCTEGTFDTTNTIIHLILSKTVIILLLPY